MSPSGRGRGIATAVVGILADLARSRGATMLVAGTDPSNVASQRVLERSGFVQSPSRADELRWTLSLAP